MADEPCVSVIIPAYNAAATIGQAIEAVAAQDYPGSVELVVVDDGSSDGTGDIVSRYSWVRLLRQDNAGPASARNHGARIARGPFLFFTDADCRPRREWIQRMMKGFEGDAGRGVAVVSGSYGIANPGSVLAGVIQAEILFRHKNLMPEFPKFFGSYNFAVRREVFETAGGFNPAYRRASGEDNDLSYKIIACGGRILFLSDACVDHYHQTSLSCYLKEQFRHGFWRVKMYAEHPYMAAGDGYTFWKDAAEVPLVAAHAIVPFFPLAGAALMLGFFFFEIFFGFFIMRTGLASIFAGCVFWLRAFARCAGFFTGGLFFLKNMIADGKKT